MEPNLDVTDHKPTELTPEALEKKNRADVMRKIRGLMAKAEGTTSAAEAAAFAAKAEELLRKHNLDFATVQMQEVERGEGVTVRGVYANVNKGAAQKISSWAIWLAAACAELFEVHARIGDGEVEVAGGKKVACKLIKFFGYEADVDVCSWTYGYLFQQVVRASVVFSETLNAQHIVGNQMKAPLAKFREAASLVLCRRLRQKRKEVDAAVRAQQEEAARIAAEHGLPPPLTSQALVIAKRALVEQKFGEFQYPDSDYKLVNSDAFTSGIAAGNRIQIDVRPVGTSAVPRKQLGS